MKKSEVPQDQTIKTKDNLKELVYATDENGNYTTALSSGWEPKAIALTNSLEAINERINIAKQQIIDGKASPILYFMELNRMELGILASYVGFWKWRVKRHFMPKVFKSLNDITLEKYAKAFNITTSELKNFKAQ